MRPFHLFSARPARSNLNGALHQGCNKLAFIFGGSAHVRLRIGGVASRFGGGGDRLVVQTFCAEQRFGLGRPNRGESHAAESNGGILTDVIRHRELYSSAGAGIHGSTAFECNVGAATPRGWNLHFNFGYKFVVRQRRCVGIFNKISQLDDARAARPKTVNGGVQSDQSVRPIAAGIGLSERSADGAAVPECSIWA